MPYTKRFNPKRFEPIKNLTDRLGGLSAGEVLEVSGLGSEDLRVTRWLLYDYLSHIAPGEFSIRVFHDEGRLRIKRRGLSKELEPRKVGEEIEKVLESLLEELILEGGRDGIEEKLLSWVREERINLSQAAELKAHWERVMA